VLNQNLSRVGEWLNLQYGGNKRDNCFVAEIVKVVFHGAALAYERGERAMPDEGMILEFIDLIYQVAAEPTAWPRLLERIGSAVGEASISLITTENFEKPIDVWLARYDSACVELRLRYYARPEMNPVVRAATTIEPLCVVPCRQFLTDREFERDPACQATLIAQDLYHGCIAALHRTGPLLSALEVYRPRARDFAASELRMLGRLVPHMANALRVNWYVGASQTHQRQAKKRSTS
jgi:hypothetical protein